MTSSIVLIDTFDINFDKKGRFKYKDDTVKEIYQFDKKEIPAVRYRFKSYGLKEQVYIKNNLKRFQHSVHIAEVELTDSKDCVGWIERVLELKEVAIFLYFDITKENVVTKTFTEAQRRMLERIKEFGIDSIERVMMRDKDGVLHMMVARPLILYLANLLGISKDKIGYCSCAFSANGLCCLTAERARDIAARYSSNSNFAIATNAVEGKNIEHQNGCYCIRHILITHAIEDTEDNKNIEDTDDRGDIKNLEQIKVKSTKEPIEIAKTVGESKGMKDKRAKTVTKKPLKLKKNTVL